MLRIVISVLSILFIGAAFAALADYPAEIILSLPHWRISLTPVAVLALVLAAFFTLWLAVLILKILSAPFFWRSALRKHKKAHAYQALSAGLQAAFIGDKAKAEAQAIQAKAALPADKEPLTALLLAEIEDLQLRQEEVFARAENAEQSLNSKPQKRLAHGKNSEAKGETRLIALKTLYEQAQARHNIAEAGSYALAAATENPALIWASLAAQAAKAQAGAWDKALELYENFARAWQRQAKKDKSGRTQAMLDYYKQVLLCGQACALFAYYPHQARQIALQAHKIRAHFVPACVLAAQILFQLDEFRKAEKLLQAQWRQMPHPDLGRVYSEAGGKITNSAKKLERAQNLAALNGENAIARMLVARAAFAAGNYALAQQQTERAMAQEPNMQGFALLAKLARKQGNAAQARIFLARALTAPAEKAWYADGKRLKNWRALAPVSHKLGACLWQSPAQADSMTEADLQEFLREPDAGETAAKEKQVKENGKNTEETAIEQAARGVALAAPAPRADKQGEEETASPVYINVDNPGMADKKA